MTRTQHRNTFNTILKKQEERSISNVYMALRKQYIRVINNVKRYGVGYAQGQISLELFNKEMGKAVTRIYLQAGLFMANRTLSQLKNIRLTSPKRNKGADTLYSPPSLTQSKSQVAGSNGKKPESGQGNPTLNNKTFQSSGAEAVQVSNPVLAFKYQTFGFNEEWVRMILDYFRRHLLEKAVIGVSNTTRERILRILNLATTEGWSNDQIVRELSDLTEIRNRARMIVRTETVRAANYGVLLGADKYDYETDKEWISVNDNRTRHSHSNVDGQKRETDQLFSNGLRFPGDPNGPANETINCRCSLSMTAKRDARGRLIPKQNTFRQVA